jgi:hypothetical protein
LWADKYLWKVLYRLERSNSGKPLKILIPSYIRKYVSGWTNYSDMVISQNMLERKMGNRGSKSNFTKKFVKEQRVDGRWCNEKKLHLRCTLMGLERGYQLKIQANQFLTRTHSTLCNSQLLNPLFITGAVFRCWRFFYYFYL